MGLFHRVADIIAANLNDLVERFEDPETMLKQAVRDMETTLEITLDRAAKVLATAKLTARELAQHGQAVSEWSARAEAAVRANDEPGARTALVHKHEHEKLVDALRDEHASADACAQRLRRQIDALGVKLAEAKRRLAGLAARRRTAEAAKVFCRSTGKKRPDSRLARAESRIAFEEAQAESLAELLDLCAEQAQADQATERYVEAELAALRQRVPVQAEAGTPQSKE
jgi:phage shock protein A